VRPADNPPNWDGLGVCHRTVPELIVRVYWPVESPIWPRFGLDPDLDQMLRSGIVANTRHAKAFIQLQTGSYSCRFQSDRWWFDSTSWVIFLVTTFSGLKWTNWCLHRDFVPTSDVFDVPSANWIDWGLLSLGTGCYFSMTCWGVIGESDESIKKWEVLRTI